MSPNIGVAHVSLAKTKVCLQEQRKTSLLLAKSSDTFLYKSLFCTSNSWPAFCLVLSVTLLRSSLITGACATHMSYVIRRNGFRLRQLGEVRKRCLYHFKYGSFSYKKALICYRRPLFTPQSRVKHVLTWMGGGGGLGGCARSMNPYSERHRKQIAIANGCLLHYSTYNFTYHINKVRRDDWQRWRMIYRSWAPLTI